MFDVYQRDGADVQGEDHEDRHPEYGLGRRLRDYENNIVKKKKKQKLSK